MMDELTKWLHNRENITFLLAVFGSALSAWNWIEKHLENRKRLKVKIKNAFCFGPDIQNEGYTEVLNMDFINKSREPIVISGLKISCQRNFNMFGERRLELCCQSDKINGKEVTRLKWFSDIFPVKIEGLGCAHVLVASTGDSKCIIPEKIYTVTVYTNKGKIYLRFLGELSNQEILSQCREPTTQSEALF